MLAAYLLPDYSSVDPQGVGMYFLDEPFSAIAIDCYFLNIIGKCCSGKFVEAWKKLLFVCFSLTVIRMSNSVTYFLRHSLLSGRP